MPRSLQAQQINETKVFERQDETSSGHHHWRIYSEIITTRYYPTLRPLFYSSLAFVIQSRGFQHQSISLLYRQFHLNSISILFVYKHQSVAHPTNPIMTSSSQYLSMKTEALQSQTPVSPARAQAAQIPLQTFTLPTFPPEAFISGLESLILTSNIKLDEYTGLLQQPFSVPDLPSSIKSLTLELFSLGYPPGFLTALGKKLSDLKAVTLYSQLFAGTTPASREDAALFLRTQTGLKELHLLDVFGPSGFFTELEKALSPSVKFLEVNYTYRHSDPQFLNTVPSKELGSMVSSGLVGLTMSISAPDVTEDEDDREGTEVGIRTVGGGDASVVVENLVSEGTGLVMLDTTMFEFGVEDVERVLDACDKVKVLGLTVGLEKDWTEILGVLGKKERGFEVLEIVGVPGETMVDKMKTDEGKSHLKKQELEKLAKSCKDLKSLKASILRTKMEQWVKDGGAWERI